MEVVVNIGISKITLNEEKIFNLINDANSLESIVLMLLNNDSTWENQNEVEFSREDAKDFLIDYFANKNYNKEYISNTLNKL